MALTYYILDVFTERPLGGNPLAVVLDADRLTAKEMQAIAREFSLSETAFVLTPNAPGHTARIRIFTPSCELPFAGHPTLGVALLLAELRMPIVNGERDAIIALEEEAGSIRVGVRLRANTPAFGEFDAPKSTAVPELLTPPEEIAAALGLIPSEIGFENHKPVLLRTTSNYAYVPVANLEAMSKLRITSTPWAAAFSDRKVEGVYVYTRQCVRTSASFHARMLAPDLGIPEDPATGSAAIGFARVIQHFDATRDGATKRIIEQGLEMGRPSTIHITSSITGGKLEGVRIGGSAVRVAEGQLHL